MGDGLVGSAVSSRTRLRLITSFDAHYAEPQNHMGDEDVSGFFKPVVIETTRKARLKGWVKAAWRAITFSL